jgi:uncharacterized membrane protein
MTDNPYAPPKTHVEDVLETRADGDFLPEGRSVPAGQGWRWIADAWSFMAGQRLVFIGVILLMWLVQIPLNFIPLLGPIVTTFLFPFLIAGFVVGCETVQRGGQLEVGHLFAGFQRHTNKLLLVGAVSFAMYILMALVMIAVLGVTVGMTLLAGNVPPTAEELEQIIVPVLLAVLIVLALSVPMTMALLFVPPLVVLHDYEVFPAVRTSFVACLKNVLPFLIWGIAGALLWLFSSILIIIGWLIVGSLLMVSLYLSYRDVFYER